MGTEQQFCWPIIHPKLLPMLTLLLYNDITWRPLSRGRCHMNVNAFRFGAFAEMTDAVVFLGRTVSAIVTLWSLTLPDAHQLLRAGVHMCCHGYQMILDIYINHQITLGFTSFTVHNQQWLITVWLLNSVLWFDCFGFTSWISHTRIHLEVHWDTFSARLGPVFFINVHVTAFITDKQMHQFI